MQFCYKGACDGRARLLESELGSFGVCGGVGLDGCERWVKTD